MHRRAQNHFPREARDGLIPFMPFGFAQEMVRQAHHERIDRPALSGTEGLTTNGINNLPFVPSLSKDLRSLSLLQAIS